MSLSQEYFQMWLIFDQKFDDDNYDEWYCSPEGEAMLDAGDKLWYSMNDEEIKETRKLITDFIDKKLDSTT